MAKTLKTIGAFFKVAAKNTFVYRGMALLWMLGWIASFITMLFLWQTASINGTIAGFTRNQIVTYYFVGLLVWAVCGWFPFREISHSIKDGTIINLITKPVDFHNSRIGTELGWHTINVLLYLLCFSVIFIFVKNFLLFDLTFWRLLVFILSLVVTALVTFEFNLWMSTVAFWIINSGGVGSLYWLVMSLFGGQIVPLAFFPKWSQTIVRLLPFRFMYSFPLEIYLGQQNGWPLLFSFAVGIFWAVAFYFLFKHFWQKGLRVYTAFGQ